MTETEGHDWHLVTDEKSPRYPRRGTDLRFKLDCRESATAPRPYKLWVCSKCGHRDVRINMPKVTIRGPGGKKCNEIAAVKKESAREPGE